MSRGEARIAEPSLSFVPGGVEELPGITEVVVRPDLEGSSFSEGGPRAWFSVVRREG